MTPSRTADLPAFAPGSWIADVSLLFPISPTRPTIEQQREQVLRLWGWRRLSCNRRANPVQIP
jgi:hypothetical protein